MSDYEPIEQRYEGLASPMSDYGCSEPTRCKQRDKAECEWCMNPMSDRHADFLQDVEVLRYLSERDVDHSHTRKFYAPELLDNILAYVTELKARLEAAGRVCEAAKTLAYVDTLAVAPTPAEGELLSALRVWLEDCGRMKEACRDCDKAPLGAGYRNCAGCPELEDAHE